MKSKDEYILDCETENDRLEKQIIHPSYCLEKELDILNFAPVEGMRIMEGACGTSPFMRLLQKKYPDLEFDIDLVDQSFDRIDYSLSKIDKVKSTHSITGIVSELSQLSQESETYDYILVKFGYQHFGDPVGITKELYKLLKKGGVLAIVDVDGILFNLKTNNEKFKRGISNIKKVLNGVDLFIGHKVRGILEESGFDESKIAVRTENMDFDTIEKRLHEADITRDRLSNKSVKNLLASAFESIKEYESFVEIAVSETGEMQNELVYEKFLVTAQK